MFFCELRLQLFYHLVDNLLCCLIIKRTERNNAIQSVSEFRSKKFIDCGLIFALFACHKTDAFCRHFSGTGIGCHNNDNITKISFSPGIIG